MQKYNSLIDDITVELKHLIECLEKTHDTIDGVVHELMTVDETSRSLKISKAMLYKLMANGTLRKGEHYIMLGDRKLFINGAELIHKLLEEQSSSKHGHH